MWSDGLWNLFGKWEIGKEKFPMEWKKYYSFVNSWHKAVEVLFSEVLLPSRIILERGRGRARKSLFPLKKQKILSKHKRAIKRSFGRWKFNKRKRNALSFSRDIIWIAWKEWILLILLGSYLCLESLEWSKFAWYQLPIIIQFLSFVICFGILIDSSKST